VYGSLSAVHRSTRFKLFTDHRGKTQEPKIRLPTDFSVDHIIKAHLPDEFDVHELCEFFITLPDTHARLRIQYKTAFDYDLKAKVQ
jgi:hypothetical protein